MILPSAPFVERNERFIVKKVRSMKTPPTLAVVLVGNDPASLSYVRQKERMAIKLGCGFFLLHLPKGVTTEYIIAQIKKLRANTAVHGIIVQLPLPKHTDTDRVISAIAAKKDIDNLRGDSPFVAPAVTAIWEMLSRTGTPHITDRIAIIGYGRVIGKPFHMFLLARGFKNIVVADSATKDISALTKDADIIVSGVGKANLITTVKKGVRIIDAGASIYKGTLVGDVDMKKVRAKAAVLTPVPGGIGPLTVIHLFTNLITAHH
ncbi:MAG: bifunctional 5,10-methylenetetrahydrofolate dehydrogenase/5,10-methenyltetrahydrofolate cyclohydrolase [Patescibacteria group bacterium]